MAQSTQQQTHTTQSSDPTTPHFKPRAKQARKQVMESKIFFLQVYSVSWLQFWDSFWCNINWTIVSNFKGLFIQELSV
jgi:hypothetical protein